jgi:5'-methylthioadenosine phosphorylase
MTALPEARLAREAEICYAIIACATDYDSWHEAEEPVSVDIILKTLRRQEDLCKQIVKLATGKIAAERDCDCPTALKNAIVTAPEAMPPAQKEKLSLLIGKYLA